MLQIHAHPRIERAQPHGINIRHLRQNRVQVLDPGEAFDLDHDGGLAVKGLVQRCARVGGGVSDAGEETERRRGARAVGSDAELHGRNNVPRLLDGVDLRDNDGGACIEGETDRRVVVAWYAHERDSGPFVHEHEFVDYLLGVRCGNEGEMGKMYSGRCFDVAGRVLPVNPHTTSMPRGAIQRTVGMLLRPR